MHPGLCVLGGFLLGAVGGKVVRSAPVHKAAVRATACGIEAKNYVSHVIDEAKAECDDIMAEAQQVADAETAQREAKAGATIEKAAAAAGAA